MAAFGEGAEIASMQSKIIDLELQLQEALQKSDALKKALESRKRFNLIKGPVTADRQAPVIQIAEKSRMVCVGMNDSRFSTNDDKTGDSNHKWEDSSSSFFNQNHADFDNPLVACSIRELGLISAPLPPILPPEPFRTPNRRSPVSPRHPTTPNVDPSNPMNLIPTYSRPNANCRRLNDLKPCLLPLKLIPPMTPCISPPQRIITSGHTKGLDAKPSTQLVLKKGTSSLSVDPIAGPILTGIAAK
ncbi:hypothetical protein Aperf_G00000068131 [Anoplocephala perfoliata]